MAGVRDLKYLNLSNNKLSSIRSEFLDDLDALQELDVSYNQLLTLHDLFKVGNYQCKCVLGFLRSTLNESGKM